MTEDELLERARQLKELRLKRKTVKAYLENKNSSHIIVIDGAGGVRVRCGNYDPVSLGGTIAPMIKNLADMSLKQSLEEIENEIKEICNEQ